MTQTDQLYTGQGQEGIDPDLGLYNDKARFYSTTLGRFVSADPVVQATTDPQSWNAYSYVRNNPVKLVDPSGMRWVHEIEAAEDRRVLQRLADTGLQWSYADWVGWAQAIEVWENGLGIAALDSLGMANCFPVCGGYDEVQDWIDTAQAEIEAAIMGAIEACAWVLVGCQAATAFDTCRSGSHLSCGTSVGVLAVTAVLPVRIKPPVGSFADDAARVVDDPLANVLAGSTARKTTPTLMQFGRAGGFARANADFDILAAGRKVVIRNDAGVRTATLSDGTKLTVRPYSSGGEPTLDIIRPGMPTIKVRYE